MWQHIIRGKYSRREAGLRGQQQLAQAMYLRQPDGTSWGAEWDAVVLPLVRRALESRASQLLGNGKPDGLKCIVSLDDEGVQTWPEWSRGFLHPEWNGGDFSEATGKKLLALLPPEEDRPASEAQPEQPMGTSARLENWLHDTAGSDKAMMPDWSSSLGPDDSVSRVADRMFHLETPGPRLETVPEEVEDEVQEDAKRLAGDLWPLVLAANNGDMAAGFQSLIERLLEAFPQMQMAIWTLHLKALVSASQGGQNTARELRAVADEVAAKQRATVQLLAEIDLYLDLAYYDKYLAVPKDADPTGALSQRVRQAAQKRGITRATLPWSGKIWQNFIWWHSRI